MASPRPAGAIDIERWTEGTIESLSTLAISAATSSPAGPRGTKVTLEIPLDVDHLQQETEQDAALADGAVMRAKYISKRGPVRRDSMKSREALLKGKEGSRRRQKWENDRLLGNPWAVQPSAKDFEPVPTHRSRRVQYSLASHWDEHRARAEMEQVQQERTKAVEEQDPSAKVPKELRSKLKHARGAKGLLQDLEEQVREFVRSWDDTQKQLEADGLADVDTSEDEEIVFVGRNGQTKESQSESLTSKAHKERMVFDSLVADQGAAFGRWLVHSIATYYDLQTWSVTRGNPARREAYVGIREASPRFSRSPDASVTELPRPLYVMV